ncbi:lipoprotein [Pediococcus stilesii]|nr:hypothetical protein [Pediococcus stilesii]
MKKMLGVVTVSATLLILSGCGNKNSEVASLKSENSSLKTELKSFENKSSKNAAKQTDKVSTTVGSVQYSISKITSEKVTNKEDNYTNAEYNMPNVKSLPKHYYRTRIDYKLKNVGKKTFDLSYYHATVIDDNGNEFNQESNSEYGFDDNSNGIVNPGTKTSGSFYLISKEPINISHFKINISEQSDGENDVGKAGVVEFK